MDMKRILQALDGAATKPVEGANDMKRFLNIVSSSPVINENKEPLVEGSNPHKVSLPVQMAMQHYQKPAPVVANEGSKHIKTSIKKFFREVQAESAEAEFKEKEQKRQLIQQYSQQIAERVLMKENAPANTKMYGTFTQADWNDAKEVKLKYENGWVGVGFRGDTAYVFADDVQVGDSNGWVTFIYNIDSRNTEYVSTTGAAFEHGSLDDSDVNDVLLDVVLEVKERLGDTSAEMHDELYGGIDLDIDEGTKPIKAKKKSDPCWSGYHQVGMKKKGNKMVPNCTKKNALKETRIIHSDAKVDVYYKPSKQQSKSQLVGRRVPNDKLDSLLHTLSVKYGVNPKDFEWKPSSEQSIVDQFDPNVSPNPGFNPGPGGPGMMNEAVNIDLLRQYRAQLDEIAGPIRELVNSQHYEFEELTQGWIGINVQLEAANINRKYSGDVFDAINDAIGAINKANGSVYNVYKIVEELKNSMDSDIEDHEFNYDDGEMNLDIDESNMNKSPITKRNPVAHAAQSVAKGSGAHKNKKREQEIPRKEKHKKAQMSEELNKIMSDPIWSEFKEK